MPTTTTATSCERATGDPRAAFAERSAGPRAGSPMGTQLDMAAVEQCLTDAVDAAHRMAMAEDPARRSKAAADVCKFARRASVVAAAIEDRLS